MNHFDPNQIQTFTGEAYDFREPTPAMIHVLDIAHALSNMCRFAGHVKHFQSVAEHSVLVSRLIKHWGGDEDAQRLGLLHDAHEAYVWDCPRPFKPLLGNSFEQFAAKADCAILEAFGIDPATTLNAGYIKDADNAVLVAEATELMHHGPDHWAGWEDTYSKCEPLPDHLRVHSFEPYQAENLFLHYASALGLRTSGEDTRLISKGESA